MYLAVSFVIVHNRFLCYINDASVDVVLFVMMAAIIES